MHAGEGRGGLIGLEEARRMAAIFIRILTCVKHNGVTEKAQAGFISLNHACALPWRTASPSSASRVLALQDLSALRSRELGV